MNLLLKPEDRHRYRQLGLLSSIALIGLIAFIVTLRQPSFPPTPVKHEALVRPRSVTASPSLEPTFVTSPTMPVEDNFKSTILARVNSHAITRVTWEESRQIDSVMSRFFAVPTANHFQMNEQRLLQRLINQEIIWQAVESQGAALTDKETRAILQQMVSDSGRTMLDLTKTLTSNRIDESAFGRHLLRLLSIERFVATESAAQQITRQTLLNTLQAQARVSFGSAAATLHDNSSAITTNQPIDIPTAEPTQTTTTPIQMSDVFPLLQIDPIALATQARATQARATQGTAAQVTAIQASTTGISTSRVVTGYKDALGMNDLLTAVNLPAFFALPRLEDGSLFTRDHLIGHPTVLSFWVSWCPYCQQQTPVLIEGAARYQTHGVYFVGINVKEDTAIVQSYADSTGINYPILLDSDGRVAALYDVSGFPVTYFLDHTGQITAQHLGALTSETLDSYLAPLIAEAVLSE